MKITASYPVVNATSVVFKLDAQQVGNLQMLGDNILEVQLRLTSTDGTEIPTNQFVTLANPCIDSLFSDVNVELNGETLNKKGRYYSFRALFAKLLSYPDGAKDTWLQAENWIPDDLHKYHPPEYDSTNEGMVRRMNLFKKRGKYNTVSTRPYTTEYQTLYGSVHTDIGSCSAGIPPGVSCKIEMTFASDEFRLNCNKITSTKHKNAKIPKIEVYDANLYIPIGKMNDKIYKSMKSRLDHGEHITCFYIRTEVTMDSIPAGLNAYEMTVSDASTMSSGRLTIGFVSDNQFNGDFLANPFQFARRFEKTNIDTGEVKSSYVHQIKLTINGVEIGQLSGTATKYDDKLSYIKLMIALGLRNTPCSNGVSYDAWLDHAGIFLFN